MLIVENREQTKAPTKTNFFYSPALRFKKGEYKALSKLPQDVAQRIRPRLILPPPKEERDQETGLFFSTPDQCVYKTAERIGRYWHNKVAFVEPRFLIEAFGEEDILSWLPKIFEVSRSYGGKPVPLVSSRDLDGIRAQAFRQSISDSGEIKVAVRVLSSEIDEGLKEKLLDGLSNLGVAPENCALFLDFSDADLSEPDVIADFGVLALESVQEIGLWQSIIFQGTNYPEHNPADPGAFTLIPRNEWLAWRQAIEADRNAAKNLLFGDYAADSAKFKFAGGGGRPIPHYRYCSGSNWLVARGMSDEKQADAIKAVCESIVKGGHFAGRGASIADDYIYDTAKGMNGGGAATDWREMNTIRHISQVVSDLGKIHGFEIEQEPVEDEFQQNSLFEFSSY